MIVRVITTGKTLRVTTPRDATVGQLKAAIAAALGRGDLEDASGGVKLSLRPSIARGSGASAAGFEAAVDDFDAAEVSIADAGVKKNGLKIYAVVQAPPKAPVASAVAPAAPAGPVATGAPPRDGVPRSAPTSCCAICGRDHMTSTLLTDASTVTIRDINSDIERRGLLQFTIELASWDSAHATTRSTRRFPRQLHVCDAATCADLRERLAREIPHHFADDAPLAAWGSAELARCDILTPSARAQDVLAANPGLLLTDAYPGPALASFDTIVVRENRAAAAPPPPIAAAAVLAPAPAPVTLEAGDVGAATTKEAPPPAAPVVGAAARASAAIGGGAGAAATKSPATAEPIAVETEVAEPTAATAANTPFVRSDLLLPADVKVPDSVTSWSELKAWREREFVRIVPGQRAAVQGVRLPPSASSRFVHQDHSRRRVGFLFGSVDGDASATPGWVNVRAIYEPPQYGMRQRALLLPDEERAMVDEVSTRVGLSCVGWIFSHRYRSTAEGSLTASELLRMARYQRKWGAHFVTLKLTKERVQVPLVPGGDETAWWDFFSLDAWQASPQCVELAAQRVTAPGAAPGAAPGRDVLLAEGPEANFVYTRKSVFCQDPISQQFELTRKIYTDFLTTYTRIVEDESPAAEHGAAAACLPFGDLFPIENRRMTSGETNDVDVSQLRTHFTRVLRERFGGDDGGDGGLGGGATPPLVRRTSSQAERESFFARLNDFHCLLYIAKVGRRRSFVFVSFAVASHLVYCLPLPSPFSLARVAYAQHAKRFGLCAPSRPGDNTMLNALLHLVRSGRSDVDGPRGAAARADAELFRSKIEVALGLGYRCPICAKRGIFGRGLPSAAKLMHHVRGAHLHDDESVICPIVAVDAQVGGRLASTSSHFCVVRGRQKQVAPALLSLRSLPLVCVAPPLTHRPMRSPLALRPSSHTLSLSFGSRWKSSSGRSPGATLSTSAR